MKHIILCVALSFCIATQFSSCKDKKATNTNTTASDTTVAAPVEVANDSQLSTGVKDATKDYPEVNATVNNGEVTLTGTVKRDRLPRLMQSIQSLHPKKVNNNLTIQP